MTIIIKYHRGILINDSMKRNFFETILKIQKKSIDSILHPNLAKILIDNTKSENKKNNRISMPRGSPN